ncbi:dihydrolipoyl dehydrogenase [Coprothermobacteraceae bacterium]|nr:dihydrolipoyl dehydrogenase [Coprothermobacteraceae bacterium]
MKLGIIGAGPGGYEAALYAAQRGFKVTLFEKAFVGGTCLNLGCIPTKAILASTELFDHIKEAEQFGITVAEAKIHWDRVQQRTLRTVVQLRKGIEYLLKKRNVELITAEARYLGDKRVEAQGQVFDFDAVIIATGSRPLELPGLKTDKKRVINSNQFFTRREVPKKALVIGTGPIGLEFADIMRAFGSEVVAVELAEQVMPLLDPDVSLAFSRIMTKKGLRFITGTSVDTVEDLGGKLRVSLTNGQTFDVDEVLIGVGRAPNSEVVHTDRIKLDRGRIVVDHTLQTTEPGVYAVGDVAGTPVPRGALAHVASHEGIFAVRHLLGEVRQMDWHAIPWVVFTNPPIGSVGMSETEAKRSSIEVKTFNVSYRAIGAATAKARTEGFGKLVVRADDNVLIGGTVVGMGADLIVNELAVAVQHRLTPEELAEVIHAHPTLSEVVKESAFGLLGFPINTL